MYRELYSISCNKQDGKENEEEYIHMVPVVKNPPTNAGDIRDTGSIPESGKSPGRGHGNSLQYSCLENPWIEEPDSLQSILSQKAGHN